MLGHPQEMEFSLFLINFILSSDYDSPLTFSHFVQLQNYPCYRSRNTKALVETLLSDCERRHIIIIKRCEMMLHLPNYWIIRIYHWNLIWKAYRIIYIPKMHFWNFLAPQKEIKCERRPDLMRKMESTLHFSHSSSEHFCRAPRVWQFSRTLWLG